MNVSKEVENLTKTEPLTRQQATDLFADQLITVARAMGRADVCGPIPTDWRTESFLKEIERIHERFGLAITLLSPQQMRQFYPESSDHEQAHQDKLYRRKRGFRFELGILRISNEEDLPIVRITNLIEVLRKVARSEGLSGIRSVLRDIYALEPEERKQTAEVDDLFDRVVTGRKLDW